MYTREGTLKKLHNSTWTTTFYTLVEGIDRPKITYFPKVYYNEALYGTYSRVIITTKSKISTRTKEGVANGDEKSHIVI